MSTNRFVFEGLDELRAALRSLPEDLRDDASVIVGNAADSAANDVRDGYEKHRESGNLAEHVVVEKGAHRTGLFLSSTGFGAGAIVKNTAKHAHIFENGTQTRRTARGWNRGAMPPGNVFIPVMVRRRREMYQRLKDMLTTHGLEVSGDA